MSLEIEIPKEIDDYQEKLFFNLTIRQLVAAGIIAAVDIPLYIFGKDIMSAELVQLLILVTGAPAAYWGFFPRKNGQKPEQIAINFYQQKFSNQKRMYKELPVFYYAREEIIAEDLARQRALLQSKRRKK